MTAVHAIGHSHTLPVTPAQLMRPGIFAEMSLAHWVVVALPCKHDENGTEKFAFLPEAFSCKCGLSV